MQRRTFLACVAGSVTARARNAATGADLLLGVDTYSLRRHCWKVMQMLDWAAAQKLDIIQATFGDFESFEPAYLKRVKEHADRVGVRLEPGFGCICDRSKGWNPRQGTPVQYLEFVIRVTRELGSPSCKVFMGNAADRAAGPVDALIEATIRALRSVRAQALDAGVKLAVENHGDLTSRELKTLIEEAGPDFTACCFDSGNAAMLGEDPVAALEVLGPYVVTSHIRDCAVYEHPRGAAVQWVALGDGSVDLPALVRGFAELCPKAPFQLEILTGFPLRVLPFLEADYWKAFPHMPASDFARFLALAKRGQPFTEGMLIARPGKLPPEFDAALRAQDLYDLERSLEYARKKLGVGIRWRL